MRGASAQPTQADHSRRESLMSSSSREPRASGKRDAMFSLNSEPTLDTLSVRNKSNEPGNQFENSVHSVFKFADAINVGGSLLEGNKDHLLDQVRSELMKQEREVGSFNKCINESQQQVYAQRLELQDTQHGYVGSRREQVRLQEELSLKEKVLRYTQIRSMHEMGEMKRAQELRVDEVSMQKLRKKS